ncbi:MAG: flagella basal body P-ring formation protein FlgA [Desulfobacteraceae bacterium 4572_35.2]|nr:MAG: flagella basal body P-ring formation protein FlgA [Desulfobacteraceae bacterium 4572_35.2]
MIRFAQSFVFLIFFLLGSYTVVLGQNIALKSSAVIPNSQITLGMIADLSPAAPQLANKRIARAPAPAKTVVLKRGQIEKILRQNSVDISALTWSGSKIVNVVGASQKISSDDIQQQIDAFLRDAEFRLPHIIFEFIPHSLPDTIILPVGSLQVDVIPAVKTIVGSRGFTLIYRVDGRTIKNLAVRGRLNANSEVVVVQQPLRRGAIISQSDVDLVGLDISKAHDPLFKLSDVVGLRVARSLRAGQIVERKNIEYPPVVTKGDFVRIIAQRGSMVLTASGVARQDGRMGEVIRVQNSSSQKEVRGRVIGPSKVKVEF